MKNKKQCRKQGSKCSIVPIVAGNGKTKTYSKGKDIWLLKILNFCMPEKHI